MECIQLLQAHEYNVEHSVGVALFTCASCDPCYYTVADYTTTYRSHRTFPEARWSEDGQSSQ